jgi:5-methylcytosine-specific restriction endonuclease McrA
MPVGMATVAKAISDLCAGLTCKALDVEYELDSDGNSDFEHIKYMNPVDWEEWITLPVRSWDLYLRSAKMKIRVPTVTIAKKFDKMPIKRFKGNPSKEAIYLRDGKKCQYTGKQLMYHEATLDHVVPKSRGGRDVWTNLVLSSKDINFKKGNSLNSEVGLKLLKQPTVPLPMPIASLIRDAKRPEWTPFLIK